MVMQLNTQPSTALALAADPRYIQRVRYREGQRLRLADLRGEQSYRNATRHRHHLAAHDWGIVDGLELEILAGADAGRPGVAVHPGFAVDGYGRELIIAHTVILDNADLIACLNRAKSKSSKDPALDVWVVYQLSQPSGARRVERTDIMLIDGLGLIRSRNLPPPGVLQSELDFAAHEVAEGDRPAGPWPVYLGTLMQGAQHEITLAMSQPRCYTYVYAGDVSSSDGRVRVTLGEQYLNDPRRFVVRMPDPDQPEQMIERMIINRRGNLALRGNLVINGNLGMTAQPMKDECGQKIAGKSQSLLLRLDPAPTPTAARPWRMYTTTVTEGEGDDQHQYREFRIELYHP
ncbi:MAG: hypothetical protein KC519_23055, partial [Anaerolineae bacterium]|nr:hypothetical protein [Anaerolineae bacterium]